jgi:hypothetical protein
MVYPVPLTTPRAISPTSVDGSLDRHADESGGPPTPAGVGRFIPRWSNVPTLTREQANANEQTIAHERFPWYHTGYIGSHHDTLVNWTDSGTIRASLHNRQVTVNRQVGTSATRNFDPFPIRTYGTQDQGHGMHTNPEQPKVGVLKNFRARQQQQPARVNRLSPAVYTGQSYSATTAVQGSTGSMTGRRKRR